MVVGQSESLHCVLFLIYGEGLAKLRHATDANGRFAVPIPGPQPGTKWKPDQMKWKPFKSILISCVCSGLILPAVPARAFALLGPFEEWMQPSNSFRLPINFMYGGPGDIGGPMWISNGYRWNVPVVSYGFDQSFLNFFGTNGVAAVEAAIQVINDLPPASGVVLTNYPYFSQLINSQAQAQSLVDLQSVTLSLLLEQLGLASPTHFVYVLRQWNPILNNYPSSEDWFWFEGFIPQYIVLRNIDPSFLVPCESVNGFAYAGQLYSGFLMNLNLAMIVTFANSVSAGSPTFSAVADKELDSGGFYTGLTADDVGGFCYLYSPTNVNYENLLSGVSGTGANAVSWVNGAQRPGINKITFVRQPRSSSTGGFLPLTNQYTDTYITNGVTMQQQVQREIAQPDFLFCAGDTGQDIPYITTFFRTGTSNWINNASLNGKLSGAGPGIIPPPVRITFANMGGTLMTFDQEEESVYDGPELWGTYNQSTNAPIIYPLPQSGSNQLTVRIWFISNTPAIVSMGRSIELSVTAPDRTIVFLQTSSNLTDWVSLGTNQVNGTVWTLLDEYPSSTERFYRIVPQ